MLKKKNKKNLNFLMTQMKKKKYLTCSIPISGSFFKTHFFNYEARTNENAWRQSQTKTNNVVGGYSHDDDVSPQY